MALPKSTNHHQGLRNVNNGGTRSVTLISEHKEMKTFFHTRYSIRFLFAYACIAALVVGFPLRWHGHGTFPLHYSRIHSGDRGRLTFVNTLSPNKSISFSRCRTWQGAYGETVLPNSLTVFSRPTSRLLSSSPSSSSINSQSGKTGRRGRRRQTKEENEAEWEILLSAFQMYKAAYGDLKVPTRFVVPSMPPWPELAWGIKLGQRVASIRATDRYIENEESRRKTLEDMGFAWRLRSSPSDNILDVSFDQIYEALVTYRRELQPGGGILAVPVNFVVPSSDPWPEATRGMPLGKKITAIRSKTFLEANPGSEDKLKKLGFQFNAKAVANDVRFNSVYNALLCYKKLNGNLEIPNQFVVPSESEEWPKDLWDLRLGTRVTTIRSQGTFIKSNPERKKLLDEIGFLWEGSSNTKKSYKKRDKMENLPSLDEGPLEIENDADAPSSFFDESSSSPSSLTLGDDFFQIRDNERSPTWAFEDEEAEQQSLQTQQAVQEKYFPRRSLEEELEEAAERAMRAGIISSCGKEQQVRKGIIDKRFPWYNDDFGEDFVFQDVVDGLMIYKEIQGNFDDLDVDFVVPDPSSASESMSEEEYNGEYSEPELNQSTKAQHSWPEALAGMKLGWITKRIRDGSLEVKHLPKRKNQLDAIGFDWGNEKAFLDIPFEKAMCAMFAYYLIRGDLFVTPDFVIPDDEPWPMVLRGYEVGKVVKRYRELQNFFEAYHMEKVRLLRRVEFLWFPDLALPLNPEDGEGNWERMVVEGVGHPFFQLNNPSVEMLDQLEAEGPNGPDGRNKDWYNYDVVRNYWEFGDIDDMTRNQTDWNPAQWLWFNGFEKLAKEHEEKYGVDDGLEIIRLIQKCRDGNITKEEYLDQATEVFISGQDEELRVLARNAGYEVDPDEDIETMMQKVKVDLGLDDFVPDPEFQRLMEVELSIDDEQEAPLVEADVANGDFEDEDGEDDEYEDVSDDDDVDTELENDLGDEDFGIEEEEL